MTVRIMFLDPRLAAGASWLPAGFPAAPVLPDFTLLTEEALARMAATGQETAEERLPVHILAGDDPGLPDRVRDLDRAEEETVVVILAGRERLAVLTETLRPILYVIHPERSFAELRAFADQLVGDGILFSEHSVLGLPLLRRQDRLGRALRAGLIRWVLKPLGRW